MKDPHGGSDWKLKTEGKLVSLKLGEPADAFFDPGDDYIEQLPSTAVCQLATKQESALSPLDEKPLKFSDEQYRAHNKQ